MSFSGLLPELINSRAAMFGMLAALGAELGTRAPVFVQVLHHLSAFWLILRSTTYVHMAAILIATL